MRLHAARIAAGASEPRSAARGGAPHSQREREREHAVMLGATKGKRDRNRERRDIQSENKKLSEMKIYNKKMSGQIINSRSWRKAVERIGETL